MFYKPGSHRENGFKRDPFKAFVSPRPIGWISSINKNGVANDPNPPTITSGIRLGSPAATTRGFKEDEFRFIGEKISTIINTLSSSNSDISMIESSIKKEVEDLCSKYPIYNH